MPELIRPARDWTLCIVEPARDRCRYTFTYFLQGYESVAELASDDPATTKRQLDAAITQLQAAGWQLTNYDDSGIMYFEPARG